MTKYSETLEWFNCTNWDDRVTPVQLIRQALRVCDKLERGEVSLDMHKAGQKIIVKTYHSMQSEEVFKEMAQELLRECEDDR